MDNARFVPPAGQPQDIRPGQRVRVRAMGVVVTGPVLTAYKSNWFGEPVTWFLEIACERTGYCYWKQAADGRLIDGGTVEVLS